MALRMGMAGLGELAYEAVPAARGVTRWQVRGHGRELVGFLEQRRDGSALRDLDCWVQLGVGGLWQGPYSMATAQGVLEDCWALSRLRHPAGVDASA